MIRAMAALPRFFLLAAIAAVALWLTTAVYPFVLLAKVILAASAAGLVLSLLYVHDFMPWEWQHKVLWFKRWFGATR